MTAKEFIVEFHSNRDLKLYNSKILEDSKLVEGIIKLIINKEEYPIAEYASWILTHTVKSDKQLLIPFQNELIDFILTENNNQSVLRNCTNILNELPLSIYKEGELIERYIDFIKNSQNKVALQVYSMQNLSRFVVNYPELKEELIAIVELYYIERSAAYKAGVRNFIKAVKKC
jgi:hypothetical protein